MATNAVATVPALLRLFSLREKFEKAWMRILAGILNVVCVGVQIFGVIIWAFVDVPGEKIAESRNLHSIFCIIKTSTSIT